MDEVTSIIKSLKNQKSCGPDEINNNIIKQTSQYISIPLQHIINLSFETGIFPCILKKAIIKPILKSGEKDNIKNYRPIAILSGFAKVLEKAMSKRLNAYLRENNVIANEQNGFQSGKSTTLAIFQGVVDMIEAIESRHFVAGIFCDLSKAFDCVDHDLLLTKLKLNGIDGTAAEWFMSHLSNRQQCVEVDGFKSGWMNIKKGVPQGSVLGPLLFLIYINDFPTAIHQKCVLFADDVTTIYQSTKPIEQIQTDIAELIKNINQYFTNNGMSLNITKTAALVPRNRNLHEIGIAPYVLTVSNNTKFLGMLLDEKLDWSVHIDYLISRISSYAFLIRKLFETCTTDVAKMAYSGYVDSLLRYGIIFYGNRPKAGQLFRGQKRCVRNIIGAKIRDSCKPIFKQLRILTLPSLYVFEAACFVKKHFEYFESNTVAHTYSTRTRSTFYIPKVEFTSTRKGVYISLMKAFNMIPNDIRRLDYNNFRNKTHDLLLEKCLYEVNYKQL